MLSILVGIAGIAGIGCIIYVLGRALGHVCRCGEAHSAQDDFALGFCATVIVALGLVISWLTGGFILGRF